MMIACIWIWLLLLFCDGDESDGSGGHGSYSCDCGGACGGAFGIGGSCVYGGLAIVIVNSSGDID